MAAEARWRLLARLFQLWRLHAYLDFMFMTRDLRMFLTYYLADAAVTLAGGTATLLLAERFAGIGRWSQPQIVFMLGYGMLANGLLDTFFSYNIRMISRRLGRGQLDHTLIQPQPVWLSLLTEGFAPFSGSALLLPGLGLMAWAALRLALPLSPAWIALLFLNVLGSAGVILAFSFVWGSAAFWAPRAAEEISMSSGEILGELKSFPLDALGPVLLGGLLTVLPVGFVAWYPSRALLGLDPHPWSVAVTPLAALVLAAASAALFLKGMQHYGRTGSQRYDSMGHRR